ncbi:MAG: UTP--glucose-1-phosphate uridylyltransferase GalU [Gammaproteobacteria bacterium]
MKTGITKAIFPVAGLGSRFLPATKANPKEMLPIVDKPLIQYAVEEAAAAGIQDLIFVTSSSKRAIEDHFDSNYELEAKLAANGKKELLALVRDVLPSGTRCAYIRQPEALGLGHAVLCARPLIGDEPFAVLLADDLIEGECLTQMVNKYQDTGGNIIAVQTVCPTEIHQYGVVAFDKPSSTGFTKINGIVEKPSAVSAPSSLGVVGRYILMPQIFNYLQTIHADKGGEIQLTDAIAKLLQQQHIYALEFEGTRYDCGSKLGYLKATIAYALKHPEIKVEFRNHLLTMIQKI